MLELDDFWTSHRCFGLHFRSQLSWLPAPRVQQPGDDAAHIQVHAPQPAHEETATRPLFFQVQGSQCSLFTRTIADFHIRDGKTVDIVPRPEVVPLKLANLLFGSTSGTLLLQRRQLALHGCSVETPSGAVIFCGDSGAGKSTLAALLHRHGRRVLDDNIAALQQDGETYQVQPGLGHMKLTPASLDLLQESARGPVLNVLQREKYLQPLTDAEFCGQPRPVRHIFILDRSQTQLLQPVRPAQALAWIQRHVFLRQMLQAMGLTEYNFHQCRALATSVPLAILGQPPALDATSWAAAVNQRLCEL